MIAAPVPAFGIRPDRLEIVAHSSNAPSRIARSSFNPSATVLELDWMGSQHNLYEE
jgi:hypothetical protein